MIDVEAPHRLFDQVARGEELLQFLLGAQMVSRRPPRRLASVGRRCRSLARILQAGRHLVGLVTTRCFQPVHATYAALGGDMRWLLLLLLLLLVVAMLLLLLCLLVAMLLDAILLVAMLLAAIAAVLLVAILLLRFAAGSVGQPLKLQRLPDFRHQSIDLLRVDRDGLFQQQEALPPRPRHLVLTAFVSSSLSLLPHFCLRRAEETHLSSSAHFSFLFLLLLLLSGCALVGVGRRKENFRGETRGIYFFLMRGVGGGNKERFVWSEVWTVLR